MFSLFELLAFQFIELEFRLEFEFKLSKLSFVFRRCSTLALRLELLFAFIRRGARRTAAIPKPTNTMNTRPRIATAQGQVRRVF